MPSARSMPPGMRSHAGAGPRPTSAPRCRAAKIMRKRRFELNAAMVLEVGKSFTEADADTAEAIDFCEFYGREMIRYAQAKPVVQMPGEKDELAYLPLGVGAVIPPWN